MSPARSALLWRMTRLGPAFMRLALARTFFRGAPLVILDEPTAALDAKAEHDLFAKIGELFAKIGELFADRSLLLISHRFSTVRSADRIYVLRACPDTQVGCS